MEAFDEGLAAWRPAPMAYAGGVLVRVRIEGAAPVERLHPAEREAAAKFGEKRVATWTAGRIALRAALRELGHAGEEPLPFDDRGAPIIPAGLVASVSHTNHLGVALALPDGGARIGVDIEALEPERLRVAEMVLTPAERALVDALPPETQWPALLLRFSVKEALYKGLDPYLRRWIGFEEVEIPAPLAVPAPGAPPIDVPIGFLPRDAGALAATATCARGGAHLISTAAVRPKG
jgi:4'-phosphopantetheinyl transferase EntD